MNDNDGRDRIARRGLRFRPDGDLRQLRAHRRSVERRSLRRSVFDLHRPDLAALEAVVEESAIAADSKLTLGETQTLSRREKLRRWKEEKALKKKFEAEKRAVKPLFKVCHLEHKPFFSCSSSLPTVSTRSHCAPPASTLRNATIEKRVTRSATAASKAFSGVAPVVQSRRPGFKPVHKAASAATARVATATAPFVENATALIAETATAPVEETATAPVEETATAPVEETATAPVAETATAPVAETAIAPVEETATAPVDGTASAPVAETASTPVAETASTPVAEAAAVQRAEITNMDNKHPSTPQPAIKEKDIDEATRVSKSTIKEVPLDVSYFRNLQNSYGTQLRKLCDEWSSTLDTEDSLSESVVGRIRSVVGKASLLMSERFNQFASLMDDCEHVRGHKITTCSDLQGFWEMFFPQVEECLEKFQKLARIRSNGFVDEDTPIKIMPRSKCAPRPTQAKCNKPDNAGQKRAARERLAAFKKMMAERMKASENSTVEQDVSAALPIENVTITAVTFNPSSASSDPLLTSPKSVTKSDCRKTPKKISLCQSVLQHNVLVEEEKSLSRPRRSLRMLQALSPLVNRQQTDLEKVTSRFPSKLNRNSDLIRFSDVTFDVKENIRQNPLADYLTEQCSDSSFES